jgi:hypothetical protein
MHGSWWPPQSHKCNPLAAVTENWKEVQFVECVIHNWNVSFTTEQWCPVLGGTATDVCPSW